MAGYDRIDAGVSVAGVNVGGLTVDEATDVIDDELGQRLAAAKVTIVPDASSAERWLENNDIDDIRDGGSYTDEQISQLGTLQSRARAGEDVSAELAEMPTVYWTVTQASLGGTVDARALAQQAYDSTRSKDPFDGATGTNRDLGAAVSFDEVELTDLTSSINATLGTTMEDYGIRIDDEGEVSVSQGHMGHQVTKDQLRDQLSAALLEGTEQTLYAPVADVPIRIDEDQANAVADTVRSAIGEPLTLAYQGQTWEASTPQIGSWVTTWVDDDGHGAYTLVPCVDSDRLADSVRAIMGDASIGTARDATFDVSSGTPVVVPSEQGTGPDFAAGADQIDDVLFGQGGQRRVEFVYTTVEPSLTTEQAQQLGINELISSYTLGYSNGNGNHDDNVEHAARLLNGSLVKPDSDWSWNTEVGECDETTGFKVATAYADGQVIEEAGGGICNVATGVFNAAYEAGLPIVERHAHSRYSQRYPIGRDAAVSWTTPDLVFHNDTGSWIFITATCSDGDITVQLWGTSPHRQVTGENGDIEQDANSFSVTNYRTVSDADGNLLWNDSFYSFYSTATES